MTEMDYQMPPIDQRLLDRLVDGELSPVDRRHLLASLDANPEGWRRCALAFLEAQAWRDAFGPSPRESSEPSPGPPPQQLGIGGRFGRLGRHVPRLAIAAGIVLAFATGDWFGGLGKQAGQGGKSSSLQIARPGDEPPRSIADSKVGHAPEVKTVGMVYLGGPTDDDSGPRQVPILSGPGLDEQWLKAQPSALPEAVRLQLERRGYQVEQHRRLVSLDLEDGQRLTVPVDQVQLEYVGPLPN